MSETSNGGIDQSMSEFIQLSLDALKYFVNAVVVFDDGISMSSSQPRITPIPAMPKRPKLMESVEQSMISAPTPVEQKGDSSLNLSPLNATVLTESFAKLGVVCSVLGAGDKEQLKDIVSLMTNKVDMAVLDWSWEGDSGGFCIELAKRFLSLGGRFVFLTIYTGSDDFGFISDKLMRELNLIQSPEDSAVFISPDSNLCVLVVQKMSAAHSFYDNSKVDEGNLPLFILMKLAAVYGGLARNVAMSALGAVRQKTHQILHLFDKNLDVPLVVNRVYSDPVISFDEYVSEIILDTIKDIVVSDLQLSQEDSIEKWFVHTHQEWESLAPLHVDQKNPSDMRKLKDFHDKNKNAYKIINNLQELKNNQKKDGIAALTTLLLKQNPCDVVKVHGELAALSYSMPMLKNAMIRLGLGTIVRTVCGESEEYFLCIIPACDAERIDGHGFNFPFIRITKIKDEDVSKSTLVIKDCTGAIVYFNIPTRWSSFKSICFKQKRDIPGPIVFDGDAVDWTVVDADNNSYFFVVKLRPLVAQKILNDFTTHSSRIGLMETEHYRLTKNKP